MKTCSPIHPHLDRHVFDPLAIPHPSHIGHGIYLPERRNEATRPHSSRAMSCRISKVTVERYSSPLGVQHPTPRISWRFEGDAEGWKQASYDVKLEKGGKKEEYHVDKADSVLVPWPSAPLGSR